jgi:hypothetical protein
VLAKPNTMRPVVEEVPDPNAKPAPGQPAPAQPAQPHPAQPAQSAPNAQPNPPRQGR